MYLCDYADNNLEAHRKEINTSWPAVEVHTRKFDASDEAAIKEVIGDALERYGRLDVFFANAGIVGEPKMFTEVDAESFNNVFRVNALGFVTPPRSSSPDRR